MIRRLACAMVGHVWIERTRDRTRALVVCQACGSSRVLNLPAAPIAARRPA